ncbi:MAG: hypothetical protein JSS72_04720 [Armatimonadetes bacterium]|nr:hypothetical protein [Armatimonadota bacterium]
MRPLLLALVALPSLAVAADQTQEIMQQAFYRMNRQGDVWFENGDFPRVIQQLRFMNRLSPSDYEVATNLGWLLESVDVYGEALATYTRFRRLNPSDPDASFPEANFYFAKKMYARVPALLEPSLKLHPHPNTFRILAHAYERMDLLTESKRVWDEYIAKYPRDLPAEANLRRVINKLNGRHSAAPPGK